MVTKCQWLEQLHALFGMPEITPLLNLSTGSYAEIDDEKIRLIKFGLFM